MHPYTCTHAHIFTHYLTCVGERVAGINAASLAVLDAGIPMRDFVCACSAGFIDGTPLLGAYTVACI